MGALDDIDSVNLHSVTIGVFENVNRPEAITCTILGSIFLGTVEWMLRES